MLNKLVLGPGPSITHLQFRAFTFNQQHIRVDDSLWWSTIGCQVMDEMEKVVRQQLVPFLRADAIKESAASEHESFTSDQSHQLFLAMGRCLSAQQRILKPSLASPHRAPLCS